MISLTIQAIYEDGKLRPLQPLPLQEHECVLLHVTRQGAVLETSGMLQGLTPDVVQEVAEGEAYSVLD
jgi:predicted DNA-binding antitoxin AbrB/MazE fold protein